MAGGTGTSGGGVAGVESGDAKSGEGTPTGDVGVAAMLLAIVESALQEESVESGVERGG